MRKTDRCCFLCKVGKGRGKISLQFRARVFFLGAGREKSAEKGKWEKSLFSLEEEVNELRFPFSALFVPLKEKENE